MYMNKIKEGEFIEGKIEFSRSGNANVLVGEDKVFIHKKRTLNSLNLDTVSVKIYKRENKIEGEVVEVITRNKTQFVGKVHKTKKATFVIPDSDKIPVDFYIKGGLVAENKQKVLVELTKWGKSKSPQGKIIKILGNSGDNNTEINSIMYEYDLPIDFPKDVKSESESVPDSISEDEIKSRRDMRDVPTVTIDPLDAKDFDDALSLNIINDNLFEIGVHIADVSHYVKKGTKLDEEAFNRATSVYLVDRVVPMLPERLSNGICSLKPNVDRLAFSVIFTIDTNGKIIKEWHGKTVIHSDKRFAYEDAQEIIESGNNSDVFSNMIIKLNELSKIIRKKRINDGSIEINSIEVRFKLDEMTKKPIGVFYKVQKEANNLIEEFMLLANKSVAKILSKAERCNIFRVHDEPNLDKLEQLKSICEEFGYSLPIDDNIKKTLNKITREIKGKPEENMIDTLITRSMSKAKYTIKNIGHYGLGFTHYSHFTSPIRRYPDLITHRLLEDYLNKKSKGNPTKIEEMAEWCSSKEKLAAKAQRDSIKYKQVEYLSDKVGQVFDGIISSITDWGMYVELTETKCDGMVKYQSLDGKWDIDTNKHVITGPIGQKIRLGDELKVVLKSADVERRQIDFEIF